MKALVITLIGSICAAFAVLFGDGVHMGAPTWEIVNEPFNAQKTWNTYSEQLGREIRLK